MNRVGNHERLPAHATSVSDLQVPRIEPQARAFAPQRATTEPGEEPVQPRQNADALSASGKKIIAAKDRYLWLCYRRIPSGVPHSSADATALASVTCPRSLCQSFMLLSVRKHGDAFDLHSVADHDWSCLGAARQH